MSDDEEKGRRHGKKATPGINPLEPIQVDHRYMYDLMFMQWYMAEDEMEMVRIGRGFISRMVSWIGGSGEFSKDDVDEAKKIEKEAFVEFKVEEKISQLGEADEHYIRNYDGYTKHIRADQYDTATASMEREWANVVLNKQQTAISKLSAMLLAKEIIALDYQVGMDAKEQIDEEVGKY